VTTQTGSSLPDIGRRIGASTAQVQLTISSYLVGFAIGQVIYGPLSDRYGRRPVLLGALAMFCGASLVCAIAPSIEVLIAARFLQAVGCAGAVVLVRAVVRDLYEGAQVAREFSRLALIMGLAPIVAPLIGGVLQTVFGWRANFVAILAFGVATATLAWTLLPETLRHRAPETISLASILRGYRAFGRHRAFLAHVGIVICAFGGLFAWISGSSFVLQDLYALTALEFGLAYAVSSGGFLLGAWLATRLVVRIGLDRCLGLGCMGLAAGGLASVLAVGLGLTSAVSLVLPMTVYFTGLGLALPQAQAGALVPFPQQAGAASSLMGVAQQSWGAVIGAIVGRLLGESAWPLVGGIAAMGCATLALWALTRAVRAQP